MKVLYINYIDMNIVESGSSVRPIKIYEAMHELGYEVEIITGIFNKYNRKERKKYINDKIQMIENTSFDYCYIEPLTTPLFKGYNPWEYKLLLTIYKKKIPIGVFYRDVYWRFRKMFNLNGFKQIILSLFHRLDVQLYKHICKIIFLPSDTMNNYLGFRNNYSLPPACSMNEIQEINNFTYTIIYVGGLSSTYGTDNMINALKKIQNKMHIKLIVICRIEEKKYLDKLINEKDNLWLEIIHANGEDLRKYYNKADVAICPLQINAYNNFAVPVKLFEYISYGKPIIATNCNETSNIVLKNNLGIIVEDNVYSICNGIFEMYSNFNEYKNFCFNIKSFAKENQWKNRVENIIEELLKK